jgi:cellulose 1,4-beta-cellobiosidase
VIAKVPTLKTYLADAASKGGKQLVQIVVYDLPDRDCAAAASNGEFSIANGGAAKYKEYIDGIVAAIKAYPDVRVVAVIEPDSLANMVTNMNVSKCSNAAATYKNSTIYAIQQLNLANVYMYLDAGHAGWLGWPANLQPAATLFADLYKQAGSPKAVRGLATNVANYNALVAARADTKITQSNPNYDEKHYIEALRPLLVSAGFPGNFIVDQGRSGVQEIRNEWGEWCNLDNAGFGIRPTTSTGVSNVDSIVWIKPGGEGDGTSNTSAVRYDLHCGVATAKKPAPEAGTWFQAYFEMLVKNANPAL